jgi:tricorn protease-like protein
MFFHIFCMIIAKQTKIQLSEEMKIYISVILFNYISYMIVHVWQVYLMWDIYEGRMHLTAHDQFWRHDPKNVGSKSYFFIKIT